MKIKKKVLPSGEIRWEVYQRTNGLKNKRIRRRFKKKIDAQKFVRSLLIASDSGDVLQETQKLTFKTEVDYWLTHKRSTFSDGYLRVIDTGLKKLLVHLEDYPLDKFNPRIYFELREILSRDGLKISTQNRYIELVVRILNFSFQHGRINFNPAFGFQRLKEPRDGINFWNEEEIRLFLKFANDKYPPFNKKRWIYVAYLMCLETGVRANELWGFSKTGIEDSSLLISKQLSKERLLVPTKGKDVRRVPLSDNLREELNILANMQTGLTLFCDQKGNPVDHDNFVKRAFKKDIKESKLKSIRFHDLRHSGITRLVKKNVPLPVVQAVAGHSNIKTTMRYVHVLSKDIEDLSDLVACS